MNISRTFLEQIPTKIPSESQQKIITEMVDKMLILNKKLVEIGKKATSETKDLNDKINNLNKEIKMGRCKKNKEKKKMQQIV